MPWPERFSTSDWVGLKSLGNARFRSKAMQVLVWLALTALAMVLLLMAIRMASGPIAIDTAMEQGLVGRSHRPISPLASRVHDRTEGGRVDAKRERLARGRILDDEDQPLAGVHVGAWCFVDGRRTRAVSGLLLTDDEGGFDIPSCAGAMCFELQLSGWVPAEPWVFDGREDGGLDLIARPQRRFYGRVVTSSGEPVERARVRFVPPDDEDVGGEVPLMALTTNTDAEGAFSVAWIERPPCVGCRTDPREGCPADPGLDEAFRVHVMADGMVPVSVQIEPEVETSFDERWSIVVEPSRRMLEGRVVDPNGAPYSEAYVLARSVWRPYEHHRAEVHADGRFEFASLAAGPYRIRALAYGVSVAHDEVDDTSTDITLQGDRLADLVEVVVEIHDAHGNPIGDAIVAGPPFQGLVRTDPTGRTPIGRALAGPTQLMVQVSGADPTTHMLDLSSNPQNDEVVAVVELIVATPQ